MIGSGWVAGGLWMIGPDPATEVGGVKTAVSDTNLLPHQIQEWQYYDPQYINQYYDHWHTDPLLKVTGNIIILRSLH